MRARGIWLCVGLAAAGCNTATPLFLPPAPETLPFSSPRDLQLQPVVADAEFPTGLAFLPDGTLLYNEKNTGRVRAVIGGQLQAEPVLDVSVAFIAEGGLLGLTVDLNVASTGWIYITRNVNFLNVDNLFPRAELQVVRFTLARDGGLFADPESERVLIRIRGRLLPGHEGGNIAFGPDGKLYVTVGDRGVNTLPVSDRPQDPDGTDGRILRFNPDGSDPADGAFGPFNPSFAIGLRNSFDFAFDPQSGLLFATENGAIGEDELNLIEPGANYGWPLIEGFADGPDEQASAAGVFNYRDPLILTDRAPTGIAFNPSTAYGAEDRGDLYFAEWVPGTVVRAELSADRRQVLATELLAEGVPGGINDLEFGPDGLIYLSTSDAVYRLVPRVQP